MAEKEKHVAISIEHLAALTKVLLAKMGPGDLARTYEVAATIRRSANEAFTKHHAGPHHAVVALMYLAGAVADSVVSDLESTEEENTNGA